MIFAFGYAATAAILITYAVLSHTGKVKPYHLANALGCVPLALVEALTGAWPAVILSVFYGVIAWYAILKGKR